MANCEPFTDRLLDFVYGLLDEADAQAVRTHLETCTDCQEAFRRAQSQQALFARAALPIGQDAVKVFDPPAGEAVLADGPEVDGRPTKASPATIAFPPPGRATVPHRRPRRRYWFAAAAAAAVLLVIGALTYAYHAGVGERQHQVVQLKDVVREIDAQLASVEPTFKERAERLERKVRSEAPLHIYTLAPAQMPPEGGAVVQVNVNGADGKPANAKVTLQLTDADRKKVLDRKEVTAKNGMASISLGRDQIAALRGQESVRLIADAQMETARAHVDELLKVAAPVYVAHLMINQSVYRPGDLLLCRALVLDRASLTPALAIPVRFSLVDAKGQVMAATEATTGEGGIAAREMAVVDPWPDGAYELRVAALDPRTDVRPHARKLRVARDGAQIVQTDRPWYRAGEIVNSWVPRNATAQNDAANAAAANAEVYLNNRRVPLLSTAQANNTGQMQGGFGSPSRQMPPPPSSVPSPPLPAAANTVRPVAPGTGGGGSNAPAYGGGMLGGMGNALNQMYLQFAVPPDIDTSRVQVRIVLTEGKVKQTFEQELAVVPSRLAVDLFPEGGDLVAGVPNRVYYRVRTPHGEPVNPEGRVIVLSGTDVLLDSAPGAGSGSFVFTPQPGDSYSVRITDPGKGAIALPDPITRVGGVHKDGLVLHVPEAVAAEGEPVEVILRNAGPGRRVLLAAECRGQFVGQQWVEANGADTRVALGALPGARGLVRLTAYEAGAGTLKPLAERLVYRIPAQRLNLSVLHLGAVIAPKRGQKGVQLEVRASDETGTPANCWAGLLIADENARSREPNPLAHFFLAGAVGSGEELDNAALLAADDPASRQALELFLGTIGWRRFETRDGAPAQAAFIGRENAPPRDLETQLQRKLNEGIAPLRVEMQQEQARLADNRQTVQTALAAALAEVHAFEDLPREYFRIGLGVALVLLLALACLALAVGAWQLVRRHAATPMFAGSFACLALCLIATVMLAWIAASPDTRESTRVADNTPRPAKIDINHPPAAPPAAATGPLALAPRALPKETEHMMGVESAKGLEHREEQLDRVLAVAPRTQRGTARMMRTLPTTNKEQKEVLRDFQQRFEDARVHQQVAMAPKASMKPFAKIAQSLPKSPTIGSGAPATEKKTTAADETKAKADASGRVFVADFVAGVESDTLLWSPALLVGGWAQVAFDAPASAGSYRVILLGNSADGRLGFYEGRLEVQPDLAR
jgi:hypothetical protein